MKYTFKSLLTLPASALTVLFLGTAVQSSHAVALTGTYVFLGSTTTPTTQTGPWNLTSTDATFGFLGLVIDQDIDFQDLADVSVNYDSNLGGIGAGSPRLRILVDFNNNNLNDAGDRSITVHWGPAGSFIDPTIGNNLNTGNLLALTDLGRYDLGGLGGSAYTDRADALSLAGNMRVWRVGILIDSFGGNNRNFDINDFSVASSAASVPESGNTFAFLGLGLAGLAGFGYRRRTCVA